MLQFPNLEKFHQISPTKHTLRKLWSMWLFWAFCLGRPHHSPHLSSGSQLADQLRLASQQQPAGIIKAQSSPHAFHCLFPVHSFVYISHHITQARMTSYIVCVQLLLIVPLFSKACVFFIEKKRERRDMDMFPLPAFADSQLRMHSRVWPRFRHPNKHGTRLHSGFLVHIIYLSGLNFFVLS